MFADLWPGLRRGRRADRLDHQRRARPDLDRARAGRDGHPDHQPGRPGRGRRRRSTSTASTASRPPTCGASGGRCAAGWSTRCAAGSARRRCPGAPPRPRSAGPTTAFDPDVLTIGFARRVPSYKRLTLMLRDPERLKALLLDPERPIQLVIAGKSHPADDGGKKLIQEMVRLRRRPGDPAPHRVPARLRHRHGPLPLLGLRRLAEQPAAPAGGLRHVGHEGRAQRRAEPLHPRRLVGRVVRRPERLGHPDRRRRRRTPTGATRSRRGPSTSCSSNQVLPRFYETGRDGVPARWVEMVRHTLRETGPKVLATRMVRDYVQRAVRAGRGLGPGDGGRRVRPGARGGRRGGRTCCTTGTTVRVAHVEATGAGDTPEIGSTLALRAEVELPGLTPDDVQVQAAYGRVDDADGLHQVTTVPMAHEHDRRLPALVHRHAPARADRRVRLHRARAPALGAHGRSGGAGRGHQCVTSTLVTLQLTIGPMHPV